MKKSEALKILGLQDGATDDEIKKVHRKLVIANHPDKFGQDAEKRAAAEEKTKLINEARDVLLSRKWDPEYSTAGTPYGAPFSYNPYAGGRPAGTAEGNPFAGAAGWPFSEGTFVWTSYDPATGTKTTYTSSGANPFAGGADPFAGFPFTGGGQSGQSPFGSSPFGAGIPFDFSPFMPKEPTKEELLSEAKADLLLDAKLIAVKLVLLVLAFALQQPATGLYLYTIISIGQGIWKRLSFLSLIFLLPAAMLAIIFAPAGNAAVGIFAFALFVLAAVFDATNVVRHVRTIAELKKVVK